MALISLVILVCLIIVFVVGISLEVASTRRKKREVADIPDYGTPDGWTEPPSAENFPDDRDYKIAHLEWMLSQTTETARKRLERIRELEK